MIIKENKEAAEFIRSKAAVDPNRYRHLPDDLKARGFTVAYVHKADVLERMRNKIAKLPEGGDWKEIRRELAEEISPFLGGNDVAAEKKAELLLRTHGFQAYAAGRFLSQQENITAMPFIMYHTVGDSNVRDEHDALDGVVLPADDDFWSSHYPPWDFGCRCFTSSVSGAGVDRLKEKERDVPVAEKRVLEGRYLEMAREGRVNRGNGRGFADVRPPREKAEKDKVASAYSWTPGVVAPDMKMLKERLSAKEFKQMELALDDAGIKV